MFLQNGQDWRQFFRNTFRKLSDMHPENSLNFFLLEQAGGWVAGGRASSIEFGVGKVDYDILYDYTNPGLTSLSSGVKYEIRRDLTDAEKAAILSRSSNLTAENLVKDLKILV